jgi:hypothetical protein
MMNGRKAENQVGGKRRAVGKRGAGGWGQRPDASNENQLNHKESNNLALN